MKQPVNNPLIKVNVSHLPLQTRIDAAHWCFEKYGFNSIEIWRASSDSFYFKSPSQATCFILKWV